MKPCLYERSLSNIKPYKLGSRWIFTLFFSIASQTFTYSADTLPNRFLDVTQSPYFADPTGQIDATDAIQTAVNDAKDSSRVCFFPIGTYLVSDTISCEQKVEKLGTPKNADGQTQHYWDVPLRFVILGSNEGGKRPVIRLSSEAQGFNDPSNPKKLIWIWAQTRNDAPGQEEPIWGKEQPNISFNHSFIGIDLDIRGHAGAIGIRHTGSQGSTLQNCTIYAEGAFAGMNNCPGQAGGTYNVTVIGGDYGLVAEPQSRFPILVACRFYEQVKASIRYQDGGSQAPMLLVGCLIDNSSGCVDPDRAIDLSTEWSYGGINLVDCVIKMNGGTCIATRRNENIHLENTYIQGAQRLSTQRPIPTPDGWTWVQRYSSHGSGGTNLIDGEPSTGEIIRWNTTESDPDYQAMHNKHWRQPASFEDEDVVNVRDFGATGNGNTNDIAAFRSAISQYDKIFIPPGSYKLNGELTLNPNTELFSVSRQFTTIGAIGRNTSFTLTTPDDPDATPALSFMSISGTVNWRSGKGFYMHATGNLKFLGNAGGAIHARMAIQSNPFMIENIKNPLSFYAFNVERISQNPQSMIRNSKHVRIYYFKVEAGTISKPDANDGNTPCEIVDSEDVSIMCMYGNVKKLGDRPMLRVVGSNNVFVSQVKAFTPDSFPHLIETVDNNSVQIPSSQTIALYERSEESGLPAPVNGPTFYENDFEIAGDVTPDFNGDTQDWSKSNGKLKPTNIWSRTYLDTQGAPALTDYTLDVDGTTITPGPNNKHTAAIMVRYQNNDQFYQIQVDKLGDLYIRKKDFGWATLANTTGGLFGTTFPRGENFKIVVTGSTPTRIDVYLNDSLISDLSATDATDPFTQGPPAFESRETTAIEWDNMLVSLPLTNLLANGGFEEDPNLTGWDLVNGGQIAINQSNPYHGLRSAQFNCNNSTIYLEQTVDIAVGTDYRVSARIKIENASYQGNDKIKFKADFLSADGTELEWNSIDLTDASTNGYALFSQTATATNSQSTQLRIRIVALGVDSGTVRIDEVSLETE